MRRSLAAALIAVLMASCSAASIVRRPVLPPLPPRLGQGTGQQLLYVGNSNSNTVTVYDFYAGTLLRTISNGVNNPLTLAVDKAGNVYSGNAFRPGSVTEYDSNGNLIRTITNGTSFPEALALDAGGTLYVGNNGSITVYPPGATSPSLTISAGIGVPSAIGVDGSGTVYSANQTNNTVTEYAAGSASILRTISGVNDPPGLAVDFTGKLVVSSCYSCSGQGGGTDAVFIYAPGATTPMVSLNQVSGPGAVAFDSLDNIYVAEQAGLNVYPVNVLNPASQLPVAPIELAINGNNDLAESDISNSVSVFLYANSNPFETITNGVAGPFGIAATP
jgi:hypothetical protein